MTSPDQAAAQAPHAGYAVRLQEAAHTYANGTPALNLTSLSIPNGQFVSLLGPSGCGKTTILKLVAGLIAPTSGQVSRMGQHATLPQRLPAGQMQAMSYVFQEATLMPWATVQTNVRLPLDLAGVAREQATERARLALARVGLAGFESHLPHQLSGGMQMRASIARSLVTQPSLLLMDEPFGALDEITRQKLDGDLLDLWLAQPNLTVVFVTHSIAEAVFLSQRIIVMGHRPGAVVADLTVDAPYPRHDDFRDSELFMQQVRQIHTIMRQA